MDDINTKRACGSCLYATRERIAANDINTVLVCRRFPPSVTMLPNGQGIAHLVLQPTVPERGWCYEFKSAPPRLVS